MAGLAQVWTDYAEGNKTTVCHPNQSLRMETRTGPWKLNFPRSSVSIGETGIVTYYVPLLLMSYHTLFDDTRATGEIPAMIMMGWNLRLPVDLIGRRYLSVHRSCSKRLEGVHDYAQCLKSDKVKTTMIYKLLVMDLEKVGGRRERESESERISECVLYQHWPTRMM